MAKTTSASDRFTELSARVDEQLHQFELAPEDYIGARVKRKKRKKAADTAGRVAVAGGAALAAAKYGPGLLQKGRNLRSNPKAAVRGYAHAGAKAAGGASNNLYQGAIAMKKGSALRKGAMKGSGVLARASKRLRRVARTFEAGEEAIDIERVVNLARRIEGLRSI